MARSHVSAPEEDPPDDDGEKRQQPGQAPFQWRGTGGVPAQARAKRPPGVVDHQVSAVQAAPEDEGPRGAVPQAAQEHGDHHVDVTTWAALAAAAERDVQVVLQEPRQGHVPAAPEVDDAGGLVRRVEIDRQRHAENARQSDGHVGIAGKVKVDLKGVGQHPAPGLEKGRRAGGGEDGNRVNRDTVCDDDLLV